MTNTKMTNTKMTNAVNNMSKDVAMNSITNKDVTKLKANSNNHKNFSNSTSKSKSKSAIVDLSIILGEHNLLEADPGQMR